MSTSEFSMSTEKVSELGATVGELTNKYLAKIEELDKLVEALHEDWKGPSYDIFKEGYETKSKALDDLNTVLSDMAKEINATAQEGETMINDIESQVG